MVNDIIRLHLTSVDNFRFFGGGPFLFNLLTFMEYASNNFFIPEEEGLSICLIRCLAARCGFNVITKQKNGQLWYRLRREAIPCEHLYSWKEKNVLNYIDIADLHIGHPDCEIERIKDTLRYAVSQQVDYVFIAGDLLDGIREDDRQQLESILEERLDMAYSIFRKYPLKIRVIPGNHEFTYDLKGLWNPLRMLEERLLSSECDFKVYDGYIQDFDLAGVVKRMMHLECYYHQENEFSIMHRLYEFNERSGLMVKCRDGVKRPIRLLQCGHYHKRIEAYDSDYNVYITQPGSFVRGQNFRTPFIHVKGEVLDDLRIVRG